MSNHHLPKLDSIPQQIKMVDYGRQAGVDALGSDTVLPNYLNLIYNDVVKRSGMDKTSIENRKQLLEREQLEAENEIEKLHKNIEHIEKERIPERKGVIAELLEKINLLKLEGIREPIDGKKVAILTTIVIGLTLYLFMFYSSVMYTILHGQEELMSRMEKGRLIFTAVFNANALESAYYQGWTTLLFICLFAFIFIGLGFMIHNALKEKKFGIVSLLIMITLVLDMIIAYLIAKNIHEVRYMANLEALPWEFMMVVTDVHFYLVIALGFVVYVIWGLLLDALINELDRSSNTLDYRQKQEKIVQLKQKIEAIEQEIIDLKQEAIKLKGKIAELEGVVKDKQLQLRQIAQGLIAIDFNDVEKRVGEFMEGWNTFLFGYYAADIADGKSVEANRIAEKWMITKREKGSLLKIA